MKEETRQKRRAYEAAYRAANRERIAAYSAAHRAANRERIAARGAAYYAANRERIAAHGAAHYAANRERIAARDKAYYAANRERIAARGVAYYAAHPLSQKQKTKNLNEQRTKRKLRKQVRLFAGIALLTNQALPVQLGGRTHVGLPDGRGAGGRPPVEA